MNRKQAAAAPAPEVEVEEVDDTNDQRDAAAAEESQNKGNQRVALLSSITSSPVIGSGMVAFLPRDMMQAIEFSKMMAGGNFVPSHLRGKPGDCLAVVLQAVRWRADPFAVAGKTYFVNDRMAYEAQLVNAVLNTSTVLDGRLQLSWQGKIGQPDFQTTVRGRIKGDEEVHELIQEMVTIKTKNSPLWVSSPRIQLGYYTSRGWGRLYTPEVMLGIYTPDEIEDGLGADAHVIGQQIIEPKTYSLPPRPTRESVRAANERTRQEQLDNEERARAVNRETPTHDAETGEIDHGEDEGQDAGDQRDAGRDDGRHRAEVHSRGAQGAQVDQGHGGAPEGRNGGAGTSGDTQPAPWFESMKPADVRSRLIKEMIKASDLTSLAEFEQRNVDAIAWLAGESEAEHKKVRQALEGKVATYNTAAKQR